MAVSREARREAWLEIPKWIRDLATADRATQSMVKNGITPKDLENEAKRGYEKGLEDGKAIALRTAYAAACLTLNKQHRFGQKRLIRFLRELDNAVCFSITSDDEIDRVEQRFKFRIFFKGDKNPLEDRIQEAI